MVKRTPMTKPVIRTFRKLMRQGKEELAASLAHYELWHGELETIEAFADVLDEIDNEMPCPVPPSSYFHTPFRNAVFCFWLQSVISECGPYLSAEAAAANEIRMTTVAQSPRLVAVLSRLCGMDEAAFDRWIKSVWQSAAKITTTWAPPGIGRPPRPPVDRN
jgi:hypothetical protein